MNMNYKKLVFLLMFLLSVGIVMGASPQVSLNYPGDGDIEVSTSPILNVTVTDSDNDNMNVSFIANDIDKYVLEGEDSGIYTTKSIEFNKTGERLYKMRKGEVVTLACSDAWNVSSCSKINNYLFYDFSGVTGFFYKQDGSKVYISEQENSKLHQYSCTNPGDMSSCSYQKNISTYSNNPKEIFFKDTGNIMYVLSGHTINEYDCTTSWEIDSCSYSGTSMSTNFTDVFSEYSFDIYGDISEIGGISFNKDGTILIETDSHDSYNDGNLDRFGAALKYECSDAWNISSCSWTGNHMGGNGEWFSDCYLNQDKYSLYIGYGKNIEGYTKEIGSENNVASGDEATTEWYGLNDINTYNWYTEVTDGTNTIKSTVWNFTTGEFNPPTMTVPPNETIESIDDWTGVDFDATDKSGIDSWWIDDTENFTISQSGHLDNNTNLSIDSYYINVSVNDTYGNTNSVIYNLIVENTPPNQPILNNPIDNSTVFSTSTTLNVTVSDYDGNYLNINFYGLFGNFSFNTELTQAGDAVDSVYADGDYVYVGGDDDKVQVYNRSTMSLKTELTQTENMIFSIYADADYVYVGGGDTNVQVYNRSTMSFKTELTQAGSNVMSVYADGDYVYACGYDDKVQVYNRSTMSLKTELTQAGNNYVNSVYADSDYVYAGGWNNVQVYNRNNMSLHTELTQAGNYVQSVYADSDYVYTGGNDNKIQVYHRNNLSLKTELTQAGSNVETVYVDADYVYAGAWNSKVQVYNRNNMSLETELTQAGSDVYSVYADADYVYAGGDDNKTQVYDKYSFKSMDTKTNVASGSTVSYNWTSLDTDTTYDWYASADDGTSTTDSSVYSFETNYESNITNVNPPNNSVQTSDSINLSVNVSDPNSDNMNVSFYNASDDSLMGIVNNVTSDSIVSHNWTNLNKNTTYEWYVTTNDGNYVTESPTWVFSTNLNMPNMTLNNPYNNTDEIPKIATLNVTYYDNQKGIVTFYHIKDGSDNELHSESGVSNNTDVTYDWTGLNASTNYDWKVSIDDGSYYRDYVYSFETEYKPNITNMNPPNNSEYVTDNINLSANISDYEGNNMSVVFYNYYGNISLNNKISMGSLIHSVYSDSDYLYVAIVNNNEVNVYNSSSLSFKTTLTQAGDWPKTVHSDSNYVYVGGEDNKVQVYNKSSLSFKTELTKGNSNINSIYSGSKYVYTAENDNNIQVYNKNDLSFVKNLTHAGGESVYSDSDYIYGAGNGANVQIYNKNDFSFVTNLTQATNNVISVKADSDYIYTGGSDENVKVYNKNDFSYIKSLSEGVGNIKDLAITSDYIYSGGDAYSGGQTSHYEIQVYDKNNLSFYKNLTQVYDVTESIDADDNYVYIGGWNETVSVYDKKSKTLKTLNEVQNGSKVEYNWNNLNTETTYDWYIEADDGIYEKESPKYSFNIVPKANKPDILSPSNNSIIKEDNVTLVANVSDSDGDDLNVTFYGYFSNFQLIKELTQSNGYVQSIHVNNKYIYEGEDGIVRVYNKSDYSITAKLTKGGGGIESICNDSKYIYTGGWDTNVQVYNKSNFSLITELTKGGATIHSVKSDSDYIYAGGWDSNVQVYNKSNFSLITELKGAGSSNIYAIEADSKYIYSAGTSGNIQVYNKSNFSFIQNLTQAGSRIFSLHTDSDYMYSGGEDEILRVYNNSNLSIKNQLSEAGDWIQSVHSDSDYFYSGGNDNKVQVYNKSDFSLVNEISNPEDIIYSVQSDSDYIYAGGRYEKTQIFDKDRFVTSHSKMAASNTTVTYNWTNLNTGIIYDWYVDSYDGTSSTKSSVYSFETNSAPTITDLNPPDNSVQTSDSDSLITPDSVNLSANVSDPDGDSMNVTFYGLFEEFDLKTELTQAVSDVYSVYADADYVYAGGDDSNVQVYHRNNMSLKTELTQPGNNVLSVYADSDYVYVGGADDKVQVYNRSTMSLYTELTQAGSDVRSVYDDADYVYASGVDTNVQVYHRNNMSLKTELTQAGDYVQSVISDTDYLYASSMDNNVRVYHRNNMSLKTNLTQAEYAVDSIHVDDDYVYACGGDKNVQVYNKSNLSLHTELPQGANWMANSVYSDDNYLYVGASDNKTQVYYKNNFSLYTELTQAGGSVWSVYADDSYVYSGGEDYNVQVYDKYSFKSMDTTTNVASGSTVSYDWTGLDTNIVYDWYVSAEDDTFTTNSSVYSFEINGEPNITDISPPNNSIHSSSNVVLSANVSDPNNDDMDVAFYENLTYFSLKTELTQGGDVINSIHADTDYLYVGGNDNKIQVYNRSTMSLNTELTQAGNWVWSVHSDSDYVYAGEYGKVQIYNKSTMNLKTELTQAGSDVYSVYADADYVYAGGDDSNVQVYHRNNMSLYTELTQMPDDVNSVYADDKYVYVGGDHYELHVYNKSTMNLTSKLVQGSFRLNSVYSDSDYIYTSGADDRVQVYNKSSLSLKTELEEAENDNIRSVYANDDYIYTGGNGNKVQVYNKSNLSLHTELTQAGNYINSVYADGKHVYVGGSDNKVQVYGGKKLIGTENNVTSGTTSSYNWDNLDTDTVYEWYAEADDGEYVTESPTLSFSTNFNMPTISLNNPPHNFENIGKNTTLNITYYDGQKGNVTFYHKKDGSDIEIYNESGVSNGTDVTFDWTGLNASTSYDWYVSADDGVYVSSYSYSFETEAKPNYTINNPVNGSINNPRDINLSVNVTDAEGDDMNISFYDGNKSSQTLLTEKTGVNNGSIVKYEWTDLNFNTTYDWYADITDGDYVTTTDTQSFTTNIQPTVDNVTIVNTPLSNETAIGFCNASDDINTSMQYEYEWYVNDNYVADTQNLTVGNFNKNDDLIFSCNVYDGLDYSGWSNSTTVTVKNTPPVINEVELCQDNCIAPYYPERNLTPVFNVTDYDGDDTQVVYDIKNSTSVIADNETLYYSSIEYPGYDFSEDNFYAGNTVTIEAYANDTTDKSSNVTASITMSNHGVIDYSGLSDDATQELEVGDDVVFDADIELYDDMKYCHFKLEPYNSTTGVFDTESITTASNTNINAQETVTLDSDYTSEYSDVEWWVYCEDESGNSMDSYSENFTVYDYTKPTMSDYEFVQNNSIVDNVLHDKIGLNASFSDVNLYSVITEVTCNKGGQIYKFNKTDISAQSFELSDNVNIENLSIQDCNINLKYSDSHTDEVIDEYEHTIDNNVIEYNTENNINIKVESQDSVVESKTDKLVDRYNFEFEYNESELVRKYVLTANETLSLRSESDYPAHFVAWNDDLERGNWIDFALENSGNFNYIINKISDNKFEIVIAHKVLTNPNKKNEYTTNNDNIFGTIQDFFSGESAVDESEIGNYTEFYQNKNRKLKHTEIGNIIGSKKFNNSKLNNLKDDYGIKKIKFNSVGSTNINETNTEFEVGGVLNMTSYDMYDGIGFTNYTVFITRQDDELFEISETYDSVTNQVANMTSDNYTIQFTHPDYVSDTITKELKTTYSECEQYYSNQSNACGGLATGDYSVADESLYKNIDNFFDNNTDTRAEVLSTYYSDIYFNYTIPDGISYAEWNVYAFGDGSAHSLPMNISGKNELQLRMRVKRGFGNDNIKFEEYNGSDWVNIDYSEPKKYDKYIYEESMSWYTKNPNVIDFEYNTSESLITFFYENVKSNDVLSNYTIYVDDLESSYSKNYSVNDNDGKTIPFLSDRDYNVTFEKNGYTNVTKSYNFDSKEEKNITLDANYYSNFSFYQESTLDPFDFNNTIEAKLYMQCDNRTEEFNLSDSTEQIPITCDYNKFKAVTEFSIGTDVETLYRSKLIPYEKSFNVDFYLIDITRPTNFVYSRFIPDDLMSRFDDINVHIKKSTEEGIIKISSDYTDMTDTFGSYLIENDDYILEIHSSNQPDYVLGSYTADFGEDKVLSLYDINLDYEIEGFSNNVKYTMKTIEENNETYVVYKYNDLEDKTESVQYRLYEKELNGTLIYESSEYTDLDSLGIVKIPLNEYNNTRVVGDIEIHHEEVGTTHVSKAMNSDWGINLGIDQYVDDNFMNWFLLILLSAIALFSTMTTSWAALGVSALGILFVMFGWLDVALGVMAIALLFGMFDMFLNKRGG